MNFDEDGKLKDELIKKMIENQKLAAEDKNPLLPSILIERDVPTGSKCPRCDKETLKVKTMPLSGAYSGSIYCLSCDFRDSVIGYLGKQMIQVQTMLQGAEQIYDVNSSKDKTNE